MAVNQFSIENRHCLVLSRVHASEFSIELHTRCISTGINCNSPFNLICNERLFHSQPLIASFNQPLVNLESLSPATFALHNTNGHILDEHITEFTGTSWGQPPVDVSDPNYDEARLRWLLVHFIIWPGLIIVLIVLSLPRKPLCIPSQHYHTSSSTFYSVTLLQHQPVHK
jgi:hypothetical protein